MLPLIFVQQKDGKDTSMKETRKSKQAADKFAHIWIITGYDLEGDFHQERLIGTKEDARRRLQVMVHDTVTEETDGGTWECDSDVSIAVQDNGTGLQAYVHFQRKDIDAKTGSPVDAAGFRTQTENNYFAERLDLIPRTMDEDLKKKPAAKKRQAPAFQNFIKKSEVVYADPEINRLYRLYGNLYLNYVDDSEDHWGIRTHGFETLSDSEAKAWFLTSIPELIGEIKEFCGSTEMLPDEYAPYCP